MTIINHAEVCYITDDLVSLNQSIFYFLHKIEYSNINISCNATGKKSNTSTKSIRFNQSYFILYVEHPAAIDNS